MRTTKKIGAGALGAALATGALLGTGVGTAAAQEACTPSTYPPVQCEVQGGARGLPLAVSATIGTPGSEVVARVAEACNAGAPVSLSLVRVANGSSPVRIGTASADAQGAFDIAGSVPADSPAGTFVLYGSCALGDDVAVYTTSFVVERPPVTSSARTSSSAAQRSSTVAAPEQDAAARTAAAIAATEIPAAWTPPADFEAAAPATRAAVAEAVNLRLAALRTSLPAVEAPVAVPQAPASSDSDLLYAAAAGAAFLALGAVGMRRRAAAPTNDEVAQ